MALNAFRRAMFRARVPEQIEPLLLASSDRVASSSPTNEVSDSTDKKPAPLIQLCVKPYRGKRTTPTDGIYSVAMSHKVKD